MTNTDPKSNLSTSPDWKIYPKTLYKCWKLLTGLDLRLKNTLNVQYWPKMKYLNINRVENLPWDHAQMLKSTRWAWSEANKHVKCPILTQNPIYQHHQSGKFTLRPSTNAKRYSLGIIWGLQTRYMPNTDPKSNTSSWQEWKIYTETLYKC